MSSNISDRRLLVCARKTLMVEGKAVIGLSRLIGKDFTRAVRLIAASPGRVAVIGIGKSGLIGRKLASTFSSTGTAAVFLHPVECLHGDMGMLAGCEVVLALSYSGETEELSNLIPLLRNRNLGIIAITGKPRSSLARLADITLHLPIKREACPYNITPTASTTAMLALGDAMALTLMKLRGFGKADFARLHPGGALGRLLTVKVSDIMATGRNNPVIRESSPVRKALCVMTKTRAGATSVVDARGRLCGFFTDGDLRRSLQKNRLALDLQVRKVMTKKPVRVFPDTMAAQAARIISERRVDNLPVVDRKTGVPVGMLDERDLLAEGFN
ncbi:MAG: KpsF/GutQ family sugar-phosphate isomerase [bacterium]